MNAECDPPRRLRLSERRGYEAAPVEVFRALRSRCLSRIIEVLHAGPRTTGEIVDATGYDRNTIAQRLITLRRRGLVVSEGGRTSKQRRHRLVRTAFGAAMDALGLLADSRLQARDMGIEPTGDGRVGGDYERLAAAVEGSGRPDRPLALRWPGLRSDNRQGRAVLDCLARGPARSGDIARALGIPSNTVACQLYRFARLGLVVSDGPARTKIYRLAPELLKGRT